MAFSDAWVQRRHYCGAGLCRLFFRLFVANVLLAGVVYGPVVVALALLAVYGRCVARSSRLVSMRRFCLKPFLCRVTFALLYTEGTDKRGAGFLPAIVGERWTAGLVLFTAIKVLAGDHIPF